VKSAYSLLVKRNNHRATEVVNECPRTGGSPFIRVSA